MSNRVKDSLINVKELISEPGATGVLSNYQDNTDPKYVGPGTWSVIHQRAYDARTHKEQLEYIVLMKGICYRFPCHVCRGHCTTYIKNHPLEEYLDIMVEIDGQHIAIGMFVWSWKFHNAVNARLKKPIMSWETAYNLYSTKESLVCSKNCLEAAGPVTNITEPVPTPIAKINVTMPKLPVSKTIVQKVPPANEPFRLITLNRNKANKGG